MDKILYSRVSENRDEQFLLSTSIFEKDGVKKVQKKAVSEKSKKHLRDIYDNYSILNKQFKSCELKAIPCSFKNNKLEFDFCEGVSLDKVLDNLLNDGKVKETVQLIEKYFKIIEKNAVKSNDVNIDETIYPSIKHHKFDEMYINLNIDAIFSNVFMSENVYIMIDYEWVMKTPVPLRYFYYRSIFWFLNDNKTRESLLKMNLFHYFGFSKKEIDLYARMENDFQNYVRGNKIPLWRFEESSNTKKLLLDNYIDYNEKMNERSRIKVYMDYGAGMSEENAYYISDNIFNNTKRIHICIPVGCIRIRIDPCEYANIMSIMKAYMVSDIADICEITLNENCLNGRVIEPNLYVFYTNDPQIYINIDSTIKEIILEFSINELTEDNAQSIILLAETYINLKKDIANSQDLVSIQKKYIDDLNHLCKEKDGYCNKLERLCSEKDEYSQELERLCSEKDEYSQGLERLCVEKDEYAKKLESLCIEKDQSHNSYSKNMQINLNHYEEEIEKLYIELLNIKGSFWYRIVSKLKRVFGRK